MTTRSRTVQHALGKHAMFGASHFMHRLPLTAALGMGRWLGRQIPWLSKRHYRRVCADMAATFPELSPAEVEALALRFYQAAGQNMTEFLRLPHLSADDINRWVHMEGLEHLEAALSRGKGAVLISGHIGNWELMGVMLGLSPYPTTAITRAQADGALTQFYNNIRAKYGLRVLHMEDARGGLRILRRNECLAMISDLNANDPACFIDFLGRPAATFTGAAFMAHTMDAAIVPAFIERQPDNTHCMRWYPELPKARTDDKARDLFFTTMRIHYVIGEEIRRRPHDWFWLLNRWKTRPESIANPDTIPMAHRDLTAAQMEEILGPVRGWLER